MKRLTFWFDVISPYAYLAFERLPEALAGLPVAISYRPLLFAGLLNQWGQKGPAAIEPKRAWTTPARPDLQRTRRGRIYFDEFGLVQGASPHGRPDDAIARSHTARNARSAVPGSHAS
jgi:hypothetical protein